MSTPTRMQTNGLPIPPVKRASAFYSAPTVDDVAVKHQKHSPDVVEPPRQRHTRQQPVTRPVTTDDLTPSRQPSFLSRQGVPVVTGMLLMFALYAIGTMWVIPFVQDKIDHWNYGEGRISHYDLDVGHNGTSHFLTEYWQGKVVVIEFVGGDPKQAHAFVMRVSQSSDRTPRVVSLLIKYVNLHGTAGKPDLVVSVTGFAVSIVLYNTGSSFQTTQP